MAGTEEKEYREYLEYQEYLKGASASADGGFDIGAYREKEEKYGGVSGAIKTGLLGAGEMATFGLSTQALTKSGLVSPETIKGLEEANPVAHVTGQVAGVVVPALLSGGASAAAQGGIKGAARLAPTNLLMRGAGRIAEGAAAALPEATTLAGKVIQGAGTTALGSAVEGAAYGAGQVIHEEALGDPTLNSEKMMSEIGYGALVGGLFGAALGGASAGLKEKFPSFISSSTDDLSLQRAANESSSLTAAEKDGVVKGLTKKKDNAKEIIADGEYFGAETLEGQIMADKSVQAADSLLMNDPSSPVGMVRRMKLEDGIEKVQQRVASSFGGTEYKSAATLGDELKEGLTKRFETQKEVHNELFGVIKQSTKHMELSDHAKKLAVTNLQKMDDYKYPSSLTRKLVDEFERDIGVSQSIDDASRIRSRFGRMAKSPNAEERYVAGEIGSRLDSFIEGHMLRSAKSIAEETADPATKQLVTDLADKVKAAKELYKKDRGEMDQIAGLFGRKRISGVSDLLRFIDEGIPAEKMAAKALSGTKSDIEALKKLSSAFPEQFETVREIAKQNIFSTRGVVKDGKIDVVKLAKEVFDDKKFSPEVREMIFTKDQLEALRRGSRWIESIPKDFNPSGTSHAVAARERFAKIFGWAGSGAAAGTAAAGPLGAVVGGIGGALAGGAASAIKDNAMLKFIQFSANASEKEGIGAIVQKLSTIERVINNSTNSIESYAGRALNVGVEMVHGVKNTFIPMSYPDKLKNFEKIKADLEDKTKDPESYLDTVTRATESLYDVAPQTTGSLQATMTAATEFLKSKMPNTDPQAPLSAPLTPSSAELSQFFRYYAVVENPYIAMKQVKAGTLTPETMETLETLYPSLLSEMRTALMDKLTAKKNGGRDLPYQTKVMLSAFLGTDLVAGLNQPNIMGNQVSFHMPSKKQDNIDMQAQMRKPSQKGMESVTLAERSRTGTQAVAQRKMNS